jgi:hypothetical protein
MIDKTWKEGDHVPCVVCNLSARHTLKRSDSGDLFYECGVHRVLFHAFVVDPKAEREVSPETDTMS